MNPEGTHAPHSSESAIPAVVRAAPPLAPDHADAVDAKRAQAGDGRALEALVQRHHSAVGRLLWRFARTPADLDDLVQETFLRMVRGLPAWRPQQPFSHWLLRLATNVGRDYFRKQAVRRRWSPDEPRAAPPEPLDPGADPAARAAANEVKDMLAFLPADDRALLTLYHLDGWELTTIAAQFGWTVTATKLRAWRARRALRALLERKGLS